MPKINRDKYDYEQRPSLKPTDLGGAQHAVLTIDEVEETNIPGPENNGAGRDAIRIVFAEFPDHNWWPNPSSLRTILNRLGDDTDKWMQERVPLHTVTSQNPRQRGTTVQNLWVVPMEEWDAQIEAYDKERAEAESKAKRTTNPAPSRRR